MQPNMDEDVRLFVVGLQVGSYAPNSGIGSRFG